MSIRSFASDKVPKPPGSVAVRLEKVIRHCGTVDFELGCGAGMHSIQYALRNSDRCLIAVEHTSTKFKAFTHHLKNANGDLKNLFPVHANAISLIAHVFPKESIERFFLLYPNPDHKAPNRRWFRAPIMGRILECLTSTGTITLATNLEWYLDEALQAAREMWNLKLMDLRLIERHEVPRTHFEKKYLERGEICFNVVFGKRDLL